MIGKTELVPQQKPPRIVAGQLPAEPLREWLEGLPEPRRKEVADRAGVDMTTVRRIIKRKQLVVGLDTADALFTAAGQPLACFYPYG